MEITREQFMELMGLEEGSDGMDYADECYDMGDAKSWWKIAQGMVASLNILLMEEDAKMSDDKMFRKFLETVTD